LRLLYLQHPWFKLWNLRRHLKHGFGRLFFRKTFHLQKTNHQILGFQVFVMGSVPFWIDPKSGPKSCGASGLPRPRATLTPRPRCGKPFRKPLRTWKIPKGPNFHGGTMGNYGKREGVHVFFGLISLMFNVFNCQIRLSGGISTSRCADSEDLFSMKSVIVFEV
jgi:hypothetical protein